MATSRISPKNQQHQVIGKRLIGLTRNKLNIDA